MQEHRVRTAEPDRGSDSLRVCLYSTNLPSSPLLSNVGQSELSPTPSKLFILKTGLLSCPAVVQSVNNGLCKVLEAAVFRMGSVVFFIVEDTRVVALEICTYVIWLW